MKQIKLTQGKFAYVDDEDFERVNQYKWYFSKNKWGGYAQRNMLKKTILMHRFILNPSKNMEIDHKNSNGLDNQKMNLRICTSTENKHNASLRKDNTSGYKGVYWIDSKSRYVSVIKLNKKRIYGGYFKDKIRAALIYDEMAVKYHGQFAKLNFPERRTY